MLVKEQTTSDNVNFVCKEICEFISDMNTNEKNTLKKHLPEFIKTAIKTKECGFNFMTGEIEIFDEYKTPETPEILPENTILVKKIQ